jgi:hypothetical protein
MAAAVLDCINRAGRSKAMGNGYETEYKPNKANAQLCQAYAMYNEAGNFVEQYSKRK